MRLPDLHDLDRRVLPEAARRLRTALDRVDQARHRAAAALRRGAEGVAAWGRRTDDRFASTGPLAVVRDVPQVALLLVAAVFVGGAFAAVQLAEPASPRSARGDGGRVAVLGVPPGRDVDAHLDAAGRALEALAENRPDTRYLALVSLTDFLPVAEVAQLASNVEVQRVYLRAPGVEGAELVEVPLAGVEPEQVLPALCTAAQARTAANAASLREIADQRQPDEQQRVQLLADADRSAAEAQAFAGECRTAFALVVEGEAVVLDALRADPRVRGIEAAPVGVTVLDLDVTPLDPTTTGSVPADDAS